MADPQFPDLVKLFVAILWFDPLALEQARIMLEAKWGSVDFTGADHPFDITNYYKPEMGTDLKRRIVTFEPLFQSELIGEAKLYCNEVEETHKNPQGRKINLDIGYLDHNKIVLASAKGAGQKIYLGKGIYADFVARYTHGRYQPFEWTFPDFKDGRYDRELAVIREHYLQQLRSKKTKTNV